MDRHIRLPSVVDGNWCWFIETAPYPVLLLVKGIVKLINDAACAFTGAQPNEILGKPVRVYLSESDLGDGGWDRHVIRLDGVVVREARARHRDGRSLPLLVHGIHLGEDAVVAVLMPIEADGPRRPSLPVA